MLHGEILKVLLDTGVHEVSQEFSLWNLEKLDFKMDGIECTAAQQLNFKRLLPGSTHLWNLCIHAPTIQQHAGWVSC